MTWDWRDRRLWVRGDTWPLGLKEAPRDYYTMRPPLDYRDCGRLGEQREMSIVRGGAGV